MLALQLGHPVVGAAAVVARLAALIDPEDAGDQIAVFVVLVKLLRVGRRLLAAEVLRHLLFAGDRRAAARPRRRVNMDVDRFGHGLLRAYGSTAAGPAVSRSIARRSVGQPLSPGGRQPQSTSWRRASYPLRAAGVRPWRYGPPHRARRW